MNDAAAVCIDSFEVTNVNRRRQLSGMFLALGLLILILDGKTAYNGAVDGIELCLKTVIPALFPFFVILDSKPIIMVLVSFHIRQKLTVRGLFLCVLPYHNWI